MVNDHRTELKIPDVQKVMDGGIDPFIEAYLSSLGTPSSAPAVEPGRLHATDAPGTSFNAPGGKSSTHSRRRVWRRSRTASTARTRAAARGGASPGRACTTKARSVRVAGRIVAASARARRHSLRTSRTRVARVQLVLQEGPARRGDVRRIGAIRHRRRHRGGSGPPSSHADCGEVTVRATEVTLLANRFACCRSAKKRWWMASRFAIRASRSRTTLPGRR